MLQEKIDLMTDSREICDPVLDQDLKEPMGIDDLECGERQKY